MPLGIVKAFWDPRVSVKMQIHPPEWRHWGFGEMTLLTMPEEGGGWGSEDQEEAVLPPTEQGPLLLWVAWAEFQGPCVFEQRLSADSAWI